MMDLSTSEKERESYVVGLRMSEDTSEYIVTYADGHEETREFSIHNYNAELYRMRDQFYAKKDKYMESLSRLGVKSVLKEARFLLGSFITILFTVSIPLPVVVKIIVILLAVISSLLKILGSHFERGLIGMQMVGIENTDHFIKLMDKLKVDVTNPQNGQKEEWFLYNLNDIGPTTNVHLLEFIAAAMPEEIKKAEGERLSLAFKELYEQEQSLEKGKTK